MNTIILNNLEDIQNLALSLIQQWYRYFLLEWDLGVWKSTLTQYLVEALWWDKNSVQSPTYTYMNNYNTQLWTFLHIDMYRLDNEHTAFQKWIFEEIENHDLIAIEWPRREEKYVDSNRIRIEFFFNPDQSRTIKISNQ